MTPPAPHHVLIAGGGVGGLEAMLALRDLAGERVSITLLSPDASYVVRALSVEDPFSHPLPRHHDLATICADAGGALIADALAVVEPAEHVVVTAAGRRIAYDDLIVATGAHAVDAFASGITFHGFEDAEAVHGLVQDVELGAVESVALVVPTGVTWPLPLYELALLTAGRARDMGVALSITLVTPEERPLGIFGLEASEAVAELLAADGIDLLTTVHARDVQRGVVTGLNGRPVVSAQRAVTLPRFTGPHVPGLPADSDGFIPVDDHGRVHGTPDVWAAGAGTTFPLKQGGIAAQQARAAARDIAARAGAPVTPRPFRPQLRAKLLTGGRPRFLSEIIVGGAGAGSSSASEEAMWWPPTKIATTYLGPYLERVGHA
jgi:sulfide:quinone oxidoreductase